MNQVKRILILSLLLVTSLNAQVNTRKEIKIPNISGYITLKCDFHMHTVFSDGDVWPTIRVEEAWREGLDAIALSDHIEYLPHKKDMIIDLNRPYEIAKEKADELGIILIKGAEITRGMPPGHFNAIFLDDAEKLKTENWIDAFKEAKKQNAFVFWNHPGWRGKPGEGVGKWYDEHSMLLNEGMFQGIEIFNETEYYPEVFQWAIDKNLTMLGNSDVHFPTNLFWDFANGEHRPMNLVFAEDKSIEAIHEALLAGRTVVYFENKLAGKKEFLTSIFYESIEIKNLEINMEGKSSQFLQIYNCSDLDYELEYIGNDELLGVEKEVTLFKNRTSLMRVWSKTENLNSSEKVKLMFRVNNLLPSPKEALTISLPLQVSFKSVKNEN